MKKLGFIGIALASLGMLAGCPASEETGSIMFTWDFASQTPCAADEEVWIGLTPNPFGGDVDQFNCDNPETMGMSGTVGGIPLGAYTIDATLHSNDNPVPTLTGLVSDPSVNIMVDGEVNNRSILFDDGTPSPQDVSFAVDFGMVGGGMNCDDTGLGGVGVNSEKISVLSGTQCLTFGISGATAGDATCTAILCQNSDLVITVDQVDPGNYMLQIEGIAFSGDTCWDQSFPFSVVDAPLALYPAGGAPGDPLNVPFNDNPVMGCQQVKPFQGR